MKIRDECIHCEQTVLFCEVSYMGVTGSCFGACMTK